MKSMDSESIYSDILISITEHAITFRRYYYPTRKDKVVRLADIECIVRIQHLCAADHFNNKIFFILKA